MGENFTLLLGRDNNREFLRENVEEVSSIRIEEEAEIKVRKHSAEWFARDGFVMGIWLKRATRQHYADATFSNIQTPSHTNTKHYFNNIANFKHTNIKLHPNQHPSAPLTEPETTAKPKTKTQTTIQNG